jgi:hypothetical protein
MSTLITESMREEWKDMIAEPQGSRDGLTRADIMTRLFENQKFWNETNAKQLTMESAVPGNATGAAIATWSPVLIKMVKRVVPNLVAMDFFGVQPLSTPDGLVFAMRVRYGTQSGSEAFYAEPDSSFSGTGTQTGSSDGLTTSTFGTGMATASAEDLGATTSWGKMAISIEKQSVTAKSRGLYADYSHELRQDMMAVHGEDVDAILSDVLVTEIQAEQNREFIRTMNTAAKLGGKKTSAGIIGTGTFDLENDTDGRWFLERLKYFMFQLELDANDIAKDTRRGKGNRIICSANVASGLCMAGMLDYNNSNLDGQKGLSSDVTGQTFAGVLSNGMSVFIDPYAAIEYYNIAYKGPTELDAGIFFSPYTPLELYRGQGEETFNPKIGFKTRYAISANPFYRQDASGTVATGNGLARGENGYFRISAVTGLVSLS